MTREMDVILQVVRGARCWADLEAIGIEVKAQGDEYSISNPNNFVAIVHAEDLAQGLLAYLEKPEDLKTWASLLLSGSSFIDFDLECHPCGDILLNTLWDAAFGEELDDAAIKTAESIAKGGQTSEE